MDLIYVDESGDPGTRNSPTKEYILVALIIPESIWHELDWRIHRSRVRMQKHLGLSYDKEIHAVDFLGGARLHLGLPAWNRVRAIRWMLKEVQRQTEARFIVVIQHKDQSTSVFKDAWHKLINQFDKILTGRALIITDTTDRIALLKALDYRWSRDECAQPQPTHPWHAKLVENPIHSDSRDSRLLQLTDLIAYLCRQALHPNHLFNEPKPRQLIRIAKRLTRLTRKRKRPPFGSP